MKRGKHSLLLAVASVTPESWWEAARLFHTALRAVQARDTSHTAADNRHCVSGLVREAGPRPGISEAAAQTADTHTKHTVEAIKETSRD